MARITKDMEQSLINAYLTEPLGGHSLAQKYGVGATTLYRVLKRNHVPIDPSKVHELHEHRHFKFPPETYQKIVEMYEGGVPVREITNKYGCSLWTILAAMRRAGKTVKRRGGNIRPWTESQKQEIVALYQSGNSQDVIGEKFGTNQTTISRILAAEGVNTNRVRESHSNWKGGRVKSGQYVGVHVLPDHPFASMRHRGGYILEHRLVMAQKLGRPLKDWETVHHINGDKSDNRPENLELRTGRHGKGIVMKCADCGSRNIVEDKLET